MYICLTFSKCAQNTQDYKEAQWFPCRRHFSCSQTVRWNTDELFIVLGVFQTYKQRASYTQVCKGKDYLCPHTYGSEHSANSLKEHGYLKNAKLGLSLSCECLTLFHDLHVEWNETITKYHNNGLRKLSTKCREFGHEKTKLVERETKNSLSNLPAFQSNLTCTWLTQCFEGYSMLWWNYEWLGKQMLFMCLFRNRTQPIFLIFCFLKSTLFLTCF